MTLVIELIIAISLLAASAFFSASETALVSLSRTKAKRLALKKPDLSQALMGWLERPNELLIVILVGNTLTVVVFAALFTTAALELFHSYPASRVGFIAWIVQIIILVIFAEMAPKFFARRNAEKTSLFVLPWLSRLRLWTRPLLGFLIKSVQLVTPSAPARKTQSSLSFNLEDLKNLLEEGSHPSPIKHESIKMMHSALKINDTRVESIMTPIEKVDMVDLHPIGHHAMEQDTIIDLIVEQGHTRTPIKWKGAIRGFIHSDDLLAFVGSKKPDNLVDLIRPALNAEHDQKVNSLLYPFRTTGTQLAFVRNKAGDIMGIVTLEDVLEEITGEILDEYDLSDISKGKK